MFPPQIRFNEAWKSIAAPAGRLALALCALVSASPWNPAAATPSADVRVNANSNPVQVYVDVWNSDGEPVYGLDPSAFQLSEDGAAQSIHAAVGPQDHPLSVVFLMDYSGSMRESNALPAMEQAVRDTLAKLDSSDRAAIIKFSGDTKVQRIYDFTNDFAALSARVADDPGVIKGSRIFDTLSTALDLFAAAELRDPPLPASSHAVILLSDGQDGSDADINALLKRLDDSDVAVFSIALGNNVQQNVLDRIALVSNGETASAANPAAIDSLYQDVVDGLKNEYVLSYNSAIGDADCAPHVMEVTVQTPEGDKRYTGAFSRCIDLPPLVSPSEQPQLIKDSSGVNGGGANDLFALMAISLFGLAAAVRRRNR
jgi:VWFA-related protein